MTDSLMNVSHGSMIPGLEDSNPAEDLNIPRIKASGKRGLFEDKVTDSEVPKMKCILLTRLKTRAMFTDGGLACKSADRRTGSQYGVCSTCEYAAKKDEEGKLLCRPSYDFLLLKENSKIPYVLTLSSPSALNPARNYISKFLLDGKPLFSRETILSFERKKKETKDGQRFDYFALVFEQGAEIDPKNQVVYQRIMDKYRGSMTTPLSDDDIPTETKTLDEEADFSF